MEQWKDRRTNGDANELLTDRLRGGQIEGQADNGGTDGLMNGRTDRQNYIWRGRRTDGGTGEPTDGRTDGQTDRLNDRWTV